MQTAIVAPIRDTGEAVRASLANALGMFLSAIPRIIGFVVVLLIGWFVASLLAKGVAALLRAIKFNDLAQRSGFAGFVQNMGVKRDSAGLVADVAKWFVRLITLVVAFDTLGLPAVSGVLQQLLLWLPNLVVALAVLVIGGLAAGALSRLVRGATAQAGFANPDTLATVAKVAVWGFAIVVAVNQLGIATNLINTLLIGVVGAIALASGLAFGLGGRDKAAAVLDRAGRQVEAAAPKLSRAASAAGDQARSMANEARSASDWRERSGFDRRSIR
jgi:Conserved TM helix